MTIEVPGGPKTASLIERVKNILLTPAAEWDRIDGEPATVKGLFMGYAVILAAIGPICLAVGTLIFGHCALFVCWRPSIVYVIVTAVLSYAAALIAVFLLGIIIEAFATTFGAQKNREQAFKVAVYASTAWWVGGVFGLVPQIAGLGFLVALYGFYILWLGLPKLTKAPADKAVAYVIVSVIVWIVVTAITLGIVGAVSGMAMFGAGMAGGPLAASDGGSFTVHGPNGNATLDLGKLQQAAKQAEATAAAANGQSAPAGGATVTPVDAGTLSAMLPGSVNGMTRGDVSSSSGSAMGIAGSEASATYTNGASHMTLKVTDMGTASGFAGLAGAMNVNSSDQNGTHYHKVNTVNGQMITEDYDTASKDGSYMVLVAGRFAVEADGTGVDMGTMKSAVGSVDQGKLNSLKNH